MNVCLAAGPRVSSVIRRMYLRSNDDYLYACLDLGQDEALVRKDKILSWMEVNADEWKARCLGSELERNVVSVTLDAMTAKALMKFNRGYYEGCSAPSEDTDGLTYPSRVRRGDVLLSINGIHVAGMSDEKVFSLLDEAAAAGAAAPKTAFSVFLRFEPAVNMIFSDPRRVISFGLDGVLKHMIDTNLVGANERIGSIPLLWYSITSAPDTSIIEYLLSIEDIDCNARLSDDEESMLPIHYCTGPMCLSKGTRYLELLAKHPSTDTNARCDGDTALHHLLTCGPHPGNDGDAAITIAELLLENEANPLLASHDGYTSLEIMGHWIADCILCRRDEHVQRMKKLLEMMQKAALLPAHRGSRV